MLYLYSMSEFIHVHLIDKRPVGTNLEKSIPLHMTVLHWFESEHTPERIIDETNAALGFLGEIATKAIEEDLFGPNSDVPVMRLEKNSQLTELHTTLLQAMSDLGVTFDSRWTGESHWNPHVTHKPDRLYSGDEVNVTDIDLITRPHKNGDRTILHRFELGS